MVTRLRTSSPALAHQSCFQNETFYIFQNFFQLFLFRPNLFNMFHNISTFTTLIRAAEGMEPTMPGQVRTVHLQVNAGTCLSQDTVKAGLYIKPPGQPLLDKCPRQRLS
jgi:hypothetical protein